MMVSGLGMLGSLHDAHRSADVWKYVGENWPELLQVLFVTSQSQDPGQREGAFRIFTTTPGIIEKQHEETVLAAFTKGFKDSEVTVSSRICTVK